LEKLDPGAADLLRDEDLRFGVVVARRLGILLRDRHQIRSRTQAMQAVSACTSAGSVAGNMAIRSWFRPSLRYGSTSTIPLARSVAASAAASTCSSKSIVPTTSERLAGSSTNGVACSCPATQLYKCPEEAPVRAT